MIKYREKISKRGTADCPLSRYSLKRKDPGATFSNTHWHPEAEILYIKQGAVRVQAGKQTFTLLPGQIAFIPPGQLHAIWSMEADSGYDAFVFSLTLLSLPESHFFQKEMIAPLLSGAIRFPYVLRPSDPPYPTVSAALDMVCSLSKDDPLYKRVVFSSMIQVFTAMMDSMEPDTTDSLQKSNETLKACLQYMSDHFSEHLTLQDIAAQVHLHPNYLCALFKDHTSQTVFQHLTRIRVESAAKLLRSQSISVSSAASACGFDSTSFFAKKFKAIMGVSPKEYSISHKTKHS